jgi:hypothetical protein
MTSIESQAQKMGVVLTPEDVKTIKTNYFWELHGYKHLPVAVRWCIKQHLVNTDRSSEIPTTRTPSGFDLS